jgi:hypothetical protein
MQRAFDRKVPPGGNSENPVMRENPDKGKREPNGGKNLAKSDVLANI